MSTTIGISLYKKPLHYVRKCVESALDQTIPSEVILRTDGNDSCDEETLDYLIKLDSLYDNFTLLEGKENLGMYGSYKKIFDYADTDNICQLDADDYLHPQSVMLCEAVLHEHPEYLMVYTDCMEIDSEGNFLGLCDKQSTPYSRENIRYKFMTFALRFMRKSVYDEVGGFDETLKYGGDYDLCLRISELGCERNIGYIPLPLYYYRRDNNCHSLSSGYKDTGKDCYTSLQKSILRRGESDTLKVIADENYQYIKLSYKVSDELYKTVDLEKCKPVILTGMHRSFTSLTSSILMELGINMGKSSIPPDIRNPEGYFEDDDFLYFDQGVCHTLIPESNSSFPEWGWSADSKINLKVLKEYEECAKKLIYDRRKFRMWGWKDPRTSFLLDLWNKVVPNANYIFVYRNPSEVYESISKLKTIQIFQDHPEYIEQCWRDHNQNILEFARRNKDRCLVIDSNELIQNPNKIKPLLIDKFQLNIYDEDLENLIVKENIRSKGYDVKLSEKTLDLYSELKKLNDLK